MSGNGIESIVNSSASFGKLNVILYFKALQNCFEVICKDVVNLFKPDEIRCSLFDLENMVMKDVEFSEFLSQKNNSILRIILIGGKEEIFIEYYQSQIIIEHLFRPDSIHILRSYSIIEKYRRKERSSVLVIGYELSIYINSFELSLKENLFDKSLHPIFVVKNDIDSNCLIEDYISDNSNVNKKKIEIISEYFKLIGVTY